MAVHLCVTPRLKRTLKSVANPGDFAYDLKQQADIVRVIGEYVQLRKAGAQNYAGLCPFHNEKSPSFSVHQSRQFFHCFGCGASGDVFTFIQKIENITFPEAVRSIAQKLGVPMPKVEYASPQEAREAKMRGALLDANELACAWFQEQLRKPDAAHAREYLKSRGLDAETVEKFRIGFAPESGFLLRDRMKGEFNEEILRESGLFSWKEDATRDSESAKSAPSALYAKFRNRIMFPIRNEQGKVIAFTGRTLATDEKSGPKYLNSPETAIYSKSRVLFNLNLAKEAIRGSKDAPGLGYAILVEGQMDCISLYREDVHNVIATSGTAFTEFQAKLLGRFTKQVVVNFDPDTAGAAAAERSLALLVSEDFQIRVLTLEPGFDPDLYIRKKGREAYAYALKHSQKYFDYLIDRARKQYPTGTPEGKLKAVNYLLPHIQRLSSKLVRDEIAMDIAHKLQIDSTVLKEELRHVAGSRTATSVKASAAPQITPIEKMLIRALASSNQLAKDPVSSREGQDLDFEAARQVHYVLANETLHAGLQTERLIAALLKAVEDGSDPMTLPLGEGDRRTLATILMGDTETLTPEAMEGAFASLRLRRMKARRSDLVVEITAAERKGDSAALGRLSLEKMQLDREIRELDEESG
ncbi:DNA primase [Candidatus Koribacter versatilis Ellin345]|uniref:DNA primase n=1 Tax=Koribacter versatilis (strain Ellin345) TaxID=204669 RepID=Q1IIK3_KORVE|nr:DNA primase [Candidatus Koribacter versatilis]ABF43297.1 DNA primase [Candidatus Koribacter versatilis Ellin345]